MEWEILPTDRMYENVRWKCKIIPTHETYTHARPSARLRTHTLVPLPKFTHLCMLNSTYSFYVYAPHNDR